MEKETRTKKMTLDKLAIIMANGFSGMEERLTKEIRNVDLKVDEVKKEVDEIKTEVSEIKTELSEVKIELSEVKTDLQTFKTETRERFDKVDESIKDLNENIEGIVGDYHPHIVALEEKVFGFSTLSIDK